jgi:hypothetical protein
MALVAGVMALSAVSAADGQDIRTPEQRMAARFPQPVRVGALIGLPVLDDNDSTLGRVREIVRSPEGRIFVVVAYNGWFGWLGWHTRPVAVPIEAVAALGRQLASLDMPRQAYAAAPSFTGAAAQRIGNDEVIRIALTRR